MVEDYGLHTFCDYIGIILWHMTLRYIGITAKMTEIVKSKQKIDKNKFLTKNQLYLFM